MVSNRNYRYQHGWYQSTNVSKEIILMHKVNNIFCSFTILYGKQIDILVKGANERYLTINYQVYLSYQLINEQLILLIGKMEQSNTSEWILFVRNMVF